MILKRFPVSPKEGIWSFIYHSAHVWNLDYVVRPNGRQWVSKTERGPAIISGSRQTRKGWLQDWGLGIRGCWEPTHSSCPHSGSVISPYCGFGISHRLHPPPLEAELVCLVAGWDPGLLPRWDCPGWGGPRAHPFQRPWHKDRPRVPWWAFLSVTTGMALPLCLRTPALLRWKALQLSEAFHRHCFWASIKSNSCGIS